MWGLGSIYGHGKSIGNRHQRGLCDDREAILSRQVGAPPRLPQYLEHTAFRLVAHKTPETPEVSESDLKTPAESGYLHGKPQTWRW